MKNVFLFGNFFVFFHAVCVCKLRCKPKNIGYRTVKLVVVAVICAHTVLTM